jgi:hypothetical protein
MPEESTARSEAELRRPRRSSGDRARHGSPPVPRQRPLPEQKAARVDFLLATTVAIDPWSLTTAVRAFERRSLDNDNAFVQSNNECECA